MNSRYTKLFETEPNLYTDGSPVIISASALYMDNEKGGNLFLLAKYRNILAKIIKGIKIEITMFDIADRKLGDIIEYSYLDMFLKNNFEYGEKIPIPIPEKNTRKYSITVKEVYFNDNSMWTSKDCNWESFGAMSTLKDYFENDDLLAQYKLQSSDHFKFVPKKTHNLWNCQCGKIHPIEVDKCCGMSYDEQIENIDIDTVNEKIYILTEKNILVQ